MSRLSPRISTLALMPVRKDSSSSSSETSISKTLILSTSFAAGATKRTLPVKIFCGYASSVMRTGWPTLHLGDVHLVQVDADDQRLQVGDGEEHRAGVERGDARGDGLAELDALVDDDAAHRRRDARHAGTRRCRRSGCRGPRRSGSASATRAACRRPGRADLEAAQRVAADEALLEERLLRREVALGVAQAKLRSCDAACTSESDCAWLTSGSTSASTSPGFTTSPSRTCESRTRPETADLTSTLMTGSTTPTSRTDTWRSSAWTLPEPEGGAVGLGIGLFTAFRLHVGGPRHGQQEHQNPDPLLLFHEKTP